MKSTCEEISEKLAGFVDGEIDAAAVSAIAAHMERCPDCRDREKTQRAVKGMLSNPALRQATPHQARARILRAIESQAERLSFGALVRRLFEFQPLPSFATLALLIALPAAFAFWSGSKIFSTPAAEAPLIIQMNSELEGEVVCVDCELLTLTKTAFVHDATHRLGLRCNNGHFWNILQTGKGTELSTVGHLMHRRIIIKGHLFPTEHVVEVMDYSVI